jgi:hypothetical protein
MSDGNFRYWDSKTENLKTVSMFEKYQKQRFHVFKGYDASDEGLLLYVKDFQKWCDELRKNKIHPINYTRYYSDSAAVELIFQDLATSNYYEDEDIMIEEHEIWEKCHNGGLTFCEPQTSMSYGYDFSSFYPRILSDKNFMIPKSKGRSENILTMPTIENLKFGIYRCKIISSDPNFKKFFTFSKDDSYTTISLKLALENQKRFNVKISLIQDDKPNAYIYDEIRTGDKVFGKWFKTLIEIKAMYPKNKLIKHLLSSVWGHLSKKNILRKTPKEIEIEKLDIGMKNARYIIKDYHVDEKEDNNEYYELLDTLNPYHFNFRLKPFISSYGRYLCAQIVLKDNNIEKLIRIQTDSATFNEEIDCSKFPNLLPEEKSTGLIEWSNVNRYKHIQADV